MGMAARGLDELLEFLLEEVALRGEQGATPSQLQQLIGNFYEPFPNHHADEQIPSRANDEDERRLQVSAEARPLVDDTLLKKVWGWLTAHADIRIEKRSKRPAKEIQGAESAATNTIVSPQNDFDQQNQQQINEVSDDASSQGPQLRPNKDNIELQRPTPNEDNSQAQQLAPSEGDDVFVRVVEDRMWQALTGHGVDFKKLPAMEFDLLSLIGAAGPQGIRQPDLIHVSGQDKRSLPHRTDELHRKGYIDKKQVRLRAHVSSICTLRRFVQKATQQTTVAVQDRSPEALNKEIFGGEILRPLVFLDIVMQLVKETGTLGAEALRKSLNLTSKLWERRASNKLLACMETVGCIRRSIAIGGGKTITMTSLRSITYVQDPSPEARSQYLIWAGKNQRNLEKTSHAAEEAESEDETVDLNVTLGVDNAQRSRLLPRWDPERPLLNILQQLTEEYGQKGVSTMDLVDHVAGPFWKRPLDHTISHLTDIWQESQPRHLRHFTIVRDTAMGNRSLHYVYRTIDNFGLAVGAGEASWEAVNAGYQIYQRKQKTGPNIMTEDAVDAWGFPALKPSLFFGRDGKASLSECRGVAKIALEPVSSLVPQTKKKTAPNQKHTQDEIGETSAPPKKRVKHVRNNSPQGPRVSKQDLVFESRSRKYAEYAARRELGLSPTISAPPVPELSLEPVKRGRRTKKARDGEENISRLRIAGHKPTEDHESAIIINDEVRVMDSDLPSSLIPETTAGGTIGRPGNANSTSPKRDALEDFVEGRLSKRPRVVAESQDNHNKVFEAKVKEILSEIFEMSRPGVYINPPARMERALGRPLKKLILVVKYDRLRDFEWFTVQPEIEKLNSASEHNISGQDPLPARENPMRTPPRPSIRAQNSRKRKRSRPDLQIRDSAAETLGNHDIPDVDDQMSNLAPSPGPDDQMKDCTPTGVPNALGMSDFHSFVDGMVQKTHAGLLVDTEDVEPQVNAEPMDPVSNSVSYKGDPAGAVKTTNTVPVEIETYHTQPDSTLRVSDVGPLHTNVLDIANLASEDDFSQPSVIHEQDSATGEPPTQHEASAMDVSPAEAVTDDILASRNHSLSHSEAGARHVISKSGTYEDPSEERSTEQPFEASCLNNEPAPLSPRIAALHSARSASKKMQADTPKPKKRSGYRRKGGVLLGAGTLGYRRSQIILEIMEKAGGVFPGDREMWYPFVVEVQKLEPNSKPDPHTVTRALKTLVATGKLRKTTFAFDKGGIMHTRHILLLPGTSVESEKVKQLQTMMIEHYPKAYLPREVEITTSARATMESLISRREAAVKKAAADKLKAEKTALSSAEKPDDEVETICDELIGTRQVSAKRVAAKKSGDSEIEPRIRKKPAQKPRPGNAANVNKESSRQPAWRKWAVEAHVEGAESSPVRGKDGSVGEQSEEEEISEDQAALQSVFSLAKYTHNHETVRQNFGSGRSTRYATLQNWHKRGRAVLQERFSETEQTAGAPDQPIGTLVRTNAVLEHIAGEPQQTLTPPERSLQHDGRLLVGDSATRSPGRIRKFAPPRANPRAYQPKINSEAWISSIEVSPAPAPQPITMLFSFWEKQQEKAAKKQARAEHVASQALVGSAPSVPLILRSTRGPPICLTLTDPGQVLHGPSGTFSTQCAVVRRMRPQLFINPNLQRDFEARLLSSLETVEPRHENAVLPSPQVRRSSFDSEIDRIQNWEETNAEMLTSRNSLILPHFINHTVPSDVADLVPWMKPEYRPPGAPRGRRKSTSKTYQPVQPSSPTRRSSRHQTEGHVLAGRNVSRKIQTSLDPAVRQVTKTPRGPRSTILFSDAMLRRFITIVVVVRALIGGNESVIKWTVVQRLMSDFDRALLRQRWSTIRVTKKVEIKRMETQFHEAFLEAYEKGIVPPIDYDRLDDYDWESVITWAQEQMTMPISGQLLELPADRKFVDEAYLVENAPDYVEFTKDDFYIPTIPEKRREEMIHDFPFSIPLHQPGNVDMNRQSDVQDIARTYVRANIFTPETQYNAQAARAKLVPFGGDVLDTAIYTLLSARVLKQENKGRAMPGRNYSMSDQFHYAFRRSFDVVSMFHDAVNYKKQIDDDFASAGYSDFSYHAQDANVLVVMNLVASGRIKMSAMTPPMTTDINMPSKERQRNEKLSIWGFAPGYKTNQMNQKNLIFPLRVTPTSSFVAGVVLPSPLPSPPAPHLAVDSTNGGRERRIPVWYDIHNKVIEPVWDLVAAAVMTAVVLRPGCSAVDVVETLRGNVEVWEVEGVVRWLVELKVLRRVRDEDGGKDGREKDIGLVAMEWWWAIFGDGH